jgi:hypothetical protein
MGIVIKLLFASLVGRLGVRGRLTEDCDVVWGRASHPHRRQGFLSGPVHPVGACQHVEVRPVSPIGWGRLVVNGPDNSSRQRLHAPTSSARIAACIPMPSRSPHPHCYASQCGVGIGGCVWEVNLWLRCPRDVWAMSGHASPPPCCSRKAVLWTLVLEGGDVVRAKYKNYRARHAPIRAVAMRLHHPLV